MSENNDTIPTVKAEGFEFVAPQRAGGSRPGRKRSDEQQQMDELVADGYGQPYTGVFCPNNESAIDAMIKRVRNSGTYLGLGIRFGQPQPTQDPDVLAIVFKVQDKRARKTKSSDDSE